MPLTIYPASHPARPVWNKQNTSSSPEALFQTACPKEYEKSSRIIQSSFNDLPAGSQDGSFTATERIVLSSHNGFVRAAWDAYAHHYHLRIRPEDVWFAILTQFSFYVNAHAEELRAHFVAHEGKKQLRIYAEGSIEKVDKGRMALQMTEEIHKNVVDPDLRAWIMPDFTTTDPARDSITAAVIMMGTMQKYFTYSFCCVLCGIPSVTLLGEREDWVKLRQRVDKLATFGRETEKWASLLIPVLDLFVRGWDEHESDEVKDFWSRIADYSSGSGFSSLTGWITAFCYFREDGKCRAKVSAEEDITVKPLADTRFPGIDPDKGEIPDAFVSVPVELMEVDGAGGLTRRFATKMVAGSVGLEVTSSGNPLDGSSGHTYKKAARKLANRNISHEKTQTRVEPGRDTLQPLTGWWMYELKAEYEAEAKQVEAPPGVTGYDSERYLE
ncbi:unnamed protein product [Discula destructiva]